VCFPRNPGNLYWIVMRTTTAKENMERSAGARNRTALRQQFGALPSPVEQRTSIVSTVSPVAQRALNHSLLRGAGLVILLALASLFVYALRAGRSKATSTAPPPKPHAIASPTSHGRRSAVPPMPPRRPLERPAVSRPHTVAAPRPRPVSKSFSASVPEGKAAPVTRRNPEEQRTAPIPAPTPGSTRHSAEKSPERQAAPHPLSPAVKTARPPAPVSHRAEDYANPLGLQ
jgi:hypothetical protein